MQRSYAEGSLAFPKNRGKTGVTRIKLKKKALEKAA